MLGQVEPDVSHQPVSVRDEQRDPAQRADGCHLSVMGGCGEACVMRVCHEGV